MLIRPNLLENHDCQPILYFHHLSTLEISQIDPEKGIMLFRHTFHHLSTSEISQKDPEKGIMLSRLSQYATHDIHLDGVLGCVSNCVLADMGIS